MKGAAWPQSTKHHTTFSKFTIITTYTYMYTEAPSIAPSIEVQAYPDLDALT
jgi:hypothetical protein